MYALVLYKRCNGELKDFSTDVYYLNFADDTVWIKIAGTICTTECVLVQFTEREILDCYSVWHLHIRDRPNSHDRG